MSGHVFISYSRSDRSYVEKLATHLKDQAIPTWYDYELETGDRFTSEIQQEIDSCAAFVVVVSPESMASTWVSREISYAVHLSKPVLPLVLRPAKPHLLLIELQQEEVLADQIPSGRFVASLRALIPPLNTRAEIKPSAPMPRAVQPARAPVAVVPPIGLVSRPAQRRHTFSTSYYMAWLGGMFGACQVNECRKKPASFCTSCERWFCADHQGRNCPSL